MVKYAFNGFLFSQRQTGVMRFAKEILMELDKRVETEEWVLVVPQYANFYPKLNKIKVVKFGNIKGNLWEQIDFARYVLKNKYVSVNFNNTMPLLCPGVTTIHDLAYKLHPEFADSIHGKISNLYHCLIFRRVAKNNVPVLTVSEFSKKQIADVYNISEERIHVLGNGWQHFEKTGKDDTVFQKNGLIDKQFYFTLGSLSKMKNTKWVFEVAKRNPNDVFVIAGSKPKNAKFESDSVLPNVILVGYITDEQIKSLISHCKAFIYPSVYDGFGIPPLEALSQGAKVICSNAACLPEIYRNAVFYINPYDFDVNLDEVMSAKVDEPMVVLNEYGWEKSALLLYDILMNSYK